MYDLINSRLDSCNISGSPFDVLQHLTDKTEPHTNKKGIMVASGKIENINVWINPAGIFFSGSLATYFFNSNIFTHTRKSTQLAVESLSDKLHLDFTKAKIKRLDVSTVIPTIQTPPAYYLYLGNKPYFKICSPNFETLYYNNHLKTLLFYDKTIEATAHNIPTPPHLKNENLLRYELRFIKSLKKQFKADVTAATLYDNDFYYSVVMMWYNEFKTIEKIKNTCFMENEKYTVTEAENAIIADLIFKAGGQQYISDRLQEAKAKNIFENKQRLYELKKKLTGRVTRNTLPDNEMIAELENKIYQTAKYAH